MTIMRHRAVLLLLALAAASAAAGVARANSTAGPERVAIYVYAIGTPYGFSDGTDGAITVPDGFSDGTDGLVVPEASAA